MVISKNKIVLILCILAMLINNIVGLSNIIVEAQTKSNRIALGVVNTATVKEAAIYDNEAGGYCYVSITGTRIVIRKLGLAKGLQKLLTTVYQPNKISSTSYPGQELIKNVTTTKYELSNQKYSSTPDLYKPESPMGSVPKELTPLLDQCITDAGFKTLDSQYQAEKANFEKTIAANDVKNLIYVDTSENDSEGYYKYGNIYEMAVIDEKSGNFCKVYHQGETGKREKYRAVNIYKGKQKLNTYKPTKTKDTFNLNSTTIFDSLYFTYRFDTIEDINKDTK